MRTGVTQALFDGSNDNAAPGYGYLAWGLNGSNVIAYTNLAVVRIFELIDNLVKELAPHMQVIITEHADLHEDCSRPLLLSDGGMPRLYEF